MGLFRKINVLKGFFWIKFEPFGSKMGLLRNINVLKGFRGKKRAFGSKIGDWGKLIFWKDFFV